MNFDTLLNNNKPQDKRFQDTRFFWGHIDRVPRGLTVHKKGCVDSLMHTIVNTEVCSGCFKNPKDIINQGATK